MTAPARLALACVAGCGDDSLCAAAADVSDEAWPEAVALFEHHFIAPLVLARLRSCAETLPPVRRIALNRAVLRSAQRSLLLQATLRSLRDDHLRPLAIRFLALKGLALGARYYGDPALRSTRDVDILVHRQDMERLLESLVGAGYVPLARHGLERPDISVLDQAIAMASLSNEVALVSPQGIPVEVHHGLEPLGDLFPTGDLLARAEPLTIWRSNWPVLPTADLVPTIAFHHARHRWSRLHWVADLTMVMRHPGFERKAALDRATAFGVRQASEAALQLPDCLRARVEGRRSDTSPLARAFADDCIAALRAGGPGRPGDRGAAGPGRIGDLLADARSEWALRDRPSARVRAALDPFAPKIADYLAFPLKPRYHRVYWLTRPLRLAAAAIRGRA